MPTIDFTSGYRDSTQGATLKALALRRAELSAALGQRKPRRIDDPWQGAAEVADTISGGIREGRLANQEAAGRARFAELLAGGLAPDEIGEAMGLDPETTMKYQERTWAQEDTKATREYESGRDVTKHGWDTEAATARVEAERKAAEAQQGATAGLQEDQQAAAKETAETGHGYDIEEKKLQSQLDIDKEKAVRETFHPVTPEEAEQWGGDVLKNPDSYQISSKTGKPELITPYNAGAAQQRKDINTAKSDLSTIDTSLNEMQRALELVDNILPGGALGKGYADIAGYDPTGTLGGERTDATKRFYQLIEGSAVKTMSAELKGSTALGELNRYISILADPNTSNEVKKQTIAGIMSKLQAGRTTVRDALKAGGGEDVGDYTYANPDILPQDAGAAATTPAPADAAAGGGAAPVFDPKIDEEGDTGSDENGNWIVKGGRWVRR